MKFKLHQPTLALLDGLKGLEIGGASHNPFGVDALNVAPLEGFDFYAAEQRRMGEAPLPIDIAGSAAEIPVDDDSQDFILSSHVVEHLPDPIRAFREWKRVVRAGGYIVMVVPHPTALPSDRGRPLTTYEDLRAAFDEKRAYAPEQDRHLWVFSADSLKAIIAELNDKGRYSLNWELVGEEAPDSKVGNGFWLAYRQL